MSEHSAHLSPDTSLHVLLIEDNPGDARLFEEHLRDSSQEICFHWEEDLDASLQRLDDADPDVIVLGLDLPESKGPETVQTVATAAPAVPIVVLTDRSNVEGALKAQEAGAAEYLRKDELTPALAGRTLQWAVQQAHMEAERQQRDAWLRTLTGNVSAGLFRAGPTGQLQYADETLLRMLGFEREELMGLELTALLASPAQQERMLAEDGVEEKELVLRRADGTELVGMLSAEAAYDADGDVLHYDGVIVDITGRRQRERALAEREAQYRAITESAQDAIITMDADSTIQFANPAVEDIFGYSPEGLIGKSMTMLMPKRHRQAHQEGLNRFLETGEETMDWSEKEFPGLRKDGTEIDLSISFATYAQNGETYFEGIMRDITERKERERELRVRSEAMEQAEEAMLITEAEPLDEPGPRIVYVNPAFEEMTGYAEAEILGKTPRILQGPESDRDVLDSLRTTLEAGESWQGETTNYRKDETPFLVQWNVAPVRDKDGDIEYWVSVQRDVTEERVREETLRRQNHLLEQTQRLAGGWEVNLATDEVLWSEKVYEVHEVPPGTEIDLDEAIDFFAPEARPQIREAFERCVEAGEPYDLELPLNTAEGSRRWVRTVGAPSETNDKEVVKVAGAFQDITDRKEAEEALREQEAQLRGLANSIPGVVFQAYARPGREYGFYLVSEHAETLLGISADPDGFFERCMERAPADERERLLALIDRTVDREAPLRFEAPFVKPSGETIWLLGTASPEPREDELVYNGVILDITERKREEARREQVIERVTDAIVEVDADWRFTLVNDQAEALYDMTEEDLLGNDFWDVFESALGTRFEETYRRVMETREPGSLTEHFSQLGGWFEVEVYPNEDGGLAFYFEDVTDRKERERRLDAVFNNTYQFTGLMEPDGTLIEANDTALAFGGLDEDDVLGAPIWDTYWFQRGPETEQRLRESVARAAEGERVRYEMEVQGAEDTRIIDFSIRPVTNEAGEVVLLVPEGRDVTDRKTAERALREERDRFATLFHNLPTPVVHGWPDEQQRIRVQAVNRAFQSTFGLASKDVQGKDLQSIIVPEQREEEAQALRRQLLKGEPIDEEVKREAGGEPRDFRLQVALRTLDETPIEGFAIYTDITEQKQRERALKDRERKIEALYAATEQLVSAHTRQEVAEQIQTLVSETFDYPLNSVHFVEDGCLAPAAVAPNVPNYVPEVPAPDLDAANLGARAYRSGETVVVEDFSAVESEVDPGKLRSGACVPLGDHGVLLVGRTQTGGPDDFDVRLLELLGTHAATVLDRIEHEETLREERDLLDRILETSPVAIVVFNPEGEFVQASGRAEEVLGLDKGEVTDRNYNDPAWDITTPEGKPMPDEKLPFARVMATGEPVHDVEHTIVWPDGRRRLLSVSGAPLHDPDGDLEGAVFHINDITERREAERQLRESERRFRKLFTEAPIGIARVDLDGQIIETNTAFRNTLGYGAEELRGRHFKSFTYEEDVAPSENTLEDLATGEGTSYTIEKRYRRADGTVFWARLTTSFLEHEGDTQIISMVQDIDDQKRYEEKLRAAKEEAERMNRLKSAFLANMSHEIRTPLTSIIGFAEVIGEQVPDDAEGTIPRYAHLIETSGHRLLNTLDGVLNLSKLEAGEMNFSPSPVNLAAEAEDTAQQFEPQARDAQIDLRVETGRTPVLCRADPEGLRVALRNLLSNAIKYTEHGGTAWVRTRTENDWAVLEVEDTGIGMDPDKTDDLFEAFAQESEGIGREYEGTGLGLTVTRRVVEELGGSIEVETRKGEGSCFTIRLPRAEDAS